MNRITIKSSDGLRPAEILVNGAAVSPYSNLASLARQPFDIFLQQLFPTLDNEIYDDYELEYEATAFQVNLLKSQAGSSSFCRQLTVRTVNVEPARSAAAALTELCRKNRLRCDEVKKLRLYTEAALPAGSLTHCVQSDAARADVCISRYFPGFFNAQIFLMESAYGLRNYDGKTAFLFPAQDIALLADYLNYAYVLGPLNGALREKLNYAQLNEADKMAYQAIVTGVPAYRLGDFPLTVDLGASFRIPFESYPAGSYFLRSAVPAVVSLGGADGYACADGAAEIQVVSANGEVVESRTVSVIRHQYVTDLRLIPQFRTLNVNEINKITVIAVPSNAEDVNELRWESSDPRVVQTDGRGNVTALSCGRAVIRVYGKAASAAVEVVVTANLQGIVITPKKLRLKPGHKQQVSCKGYPYDSAPLQPMWSFDNTAIGVCRPVGDGRKCVVISGNRVKARSNLICVDQLTGLRAYCPVDITPKMSAVELLVALLLLVCIVVPPFQIVSLLAGIVFAVLIGVNQPFFSKKATALTIILSILAGIVWILIDAF